MGIPLAVWLAIVRLALSFAVKAAGFLRNEQLLQAGEARVVTRQMAALSRALGLAGEVTAQIAEMSDEEVDGVLDKFFSERA
ncbi:MAG: hypothetical protein Q8P46_07035 [Hyphomicrobiales bacterium]|nr:hypothetical protein [Hyphomicrobiales bacterium]